MYLTVAADRFYLVRCLSRQVALSAVATVNDRNILYYDKVVSLAEALGGEPHFSAIFSAEIADHIIIPVLQKR